MSEKYGAAGKGGKRPKHPIAPSVTEDSVPVGYSEKLLRAAISFISRSVKLHTVIVDSVKIRVELLASLGEALSSTKSGMLDFFDYSLKKVSV